MVAAIKTKRFTGGEDIANAISHLAGTLLSVAGLVLMVVFAAIHGNGWHIVSASIFGTSMIFLYFCSTLAHWLPEGNSKDRFFILDQAAIYILIAGTYTPLSLVALHGALGWTVFAIEWSMALLGIIRLVTRTARFEDGVGLADILIYVIMGWFVVLVSGPVLRSLSLMGYLWIIAGGIFYTSGVIFFRFTRFRYSHLIWHLMVIAGSAAHFTAIFFYVIL